MTDNCNKCSLLKTTLYFKSFSFHFSRLLKKIDKERQKKLKQERRMLKNGGYAAICRLKRETEEKTLEIQDDLSDLLEKRNDGLRLVIFELFLQIS